MSSSASGSGSGSSSARSGKSHASSASDAAQEKLDRHNIEATANPLSKLFFCYISPLLNRGAKHTLTRDDLYEMKPDELAEDIATTFEGMWNDAKSKGTGATFAGIMWRWKRGSLIASFILSVFVALGPVTPPFVLQYFIPWLYGKEHPTNMFTPYKPLWWGAGYILLIALVPVVTGFCEAVAMRLLIHTGIVARVGANSAVYRKALKLSAKAKGQSTTGQIVNLMSNDAERLFQFPINIIQIIGLPVQLIAALALLFYNIGISTFGGLIVAFLIIPINGIIGAVFKSAITDKLKFADQRIKLMNELLSGMKVVKLNTYEVPLVDRINEVRAKEVAAVKRIRRAFAFFFFLISIAPNFIFLGAMALRIAMKEELTVAVIFLANSLFEVLRLPLSLLAIMIMQVFTTQASARRLEKFLNLEELEPVEEDKQVKVGTIKIKGSFAWGVAEKEVVAVKPKTKGCCCCKRAIHATNPEVELSRASSRSGSSSASDSESGSDAESAKKSAPSVGAGEDDEHAKRLVTLTDIDMEVAPGQLTMIVGSVGSGKSSLIAAILGNIPKHGEEAELAFRGKIAYVPQTAWIINATLKDNILFGKPYNKEKYEEAIRVCSLESDLAMLPAGDQTEIGERGINVSGGQKQRISIARAVYSDADIYLFDDPLSAVDAHVGKHIFEECINGALKGRTRILATNQLVVVPDADDILFLSSDGHVAEHGTFHELMEAERDFAVMYEENMGKVSEGEEAAAQAAKEAAALTVAAGVGKAHGKAAKHGVNTNKAGAGATLVQNEDMAAGKVSMRVYGQYCNALGGGAFGFFWILLMILSIGVRTVSSFELAYMSDGTLNHKVGADWTVNTQLGVFAIIILIYTLFTLALQMFFYPATVRTSTNIHKSLLARVVRAPMHFFDMTPLGRVLNRFSKDIDQVDMELPSNFSMYVQMSFQFIALLTTMGVSAPYFLIAIVPLAVIYGYIQNYYRSSSIELQRLDSTTRSPIFAHFSEALDGADSIRAYRLSNQFDRKNSYKLNNNHEAYISVQLANLWLKIRLNLLGGLLMLVVGFVVVFTRDNDNFNIGLSSLAVTQSFSITQLMSSYVLIGTRLEQQMNSIERLYEYIGMPNEAPAKIEDSEPAAEWPTKGEVAFKDVTMRYREDLDNVLKNVTFTVKPKEKVGIVGRSGSGKSSLMVTLFRLVEINEGKITLDGVDLKTLGLDNVRRAIAIIPQDPVLFAGSIRENMDPFNERSEAEVQRAIDIAVLRELVDSLPDGINTIVAEGGSNFSVGQRQLFCLARAVLRNAKILVLDEATASVDADTDRKIQLAVRKHFKDCTTLTIAHRLNTIMDCDRILVMDRGLVGEYDTPAALLEDPESHLSKLVENTGPSTAEHLRRIAFGEAQVVTDSQEGVASDSSSD